MKKNAYAQVRGGKKSPARIAVIVTAIVLLAALLFGIVWTTVDHSYRYDRVDLAAFFKDGVIRTELEELVKLPIRLETDVSKDDVTAQVGTNLINIQQLDPYKKTGADANITTSLPFADTVYLYYEILGPGENEGDPQVVLMSNVMYADPAKATVVTLGSQKLNEMIEKYMQEFPEFGTTVERRTDADTLISELPGCTLVLDVSVTYKTDVTDTNGVTTPNVEKNYLSLKDFYYQPATPQPAGKTYYTGASAVLTSTTATDSSVKAIDADLIAEINEKAATLTKVGEVIEGDMNLTLDSTTAEKPAHYKITLKSVFLAEMKVGTIDLDNEDSTYPFKGMTFSYKDSSGSTKKVSEGMLTVRLTPEAVLSLDRNTVEELTKGKEDFTAPTDLGTSEDAAYAQAYIDYVEAGMRRDSEKAIKESAESYAQKVRTALWNEVVERFSKSDVIAKLPESEKQAMYDAQMEYHKNTYATTYADGKTYKSLEEYILRAVYEDDDAAKKTAAEQKEAIRSYIEADVREAIVEKIVLFALAGENDLTATGKEIRDYKKSFRASKEAYYLSMYKMYYASTMSEGEMKVMAKDTAKAEANAYSKTYYRECVLLEKVQKLLVPNPAEYQYVTWTLEGELED